MAWKQSFDRSAAWIAALPIALLSIAVGLAGFASPDGVMTLRRMYFATPGLFYAAVAIRSAMGLGLILAAPSSRWPRTLRGRGGFSYKMSLKERLRILGD